MAKPPRGASLALEFKQVPSKKAARETRAAEAKQRYSREFSPDGLVGPGVCGELGSALALVKQQGSQMQLSATAGFEQLKDLISQQGKVQADFDAAEVAAMRPGALTGECSGSRSRLRPRIAPTLSCGGCVLRQARPKAPRALNYSPPSNVVS